MILSFVKLFSLVSVGVDLSVRFSVSYSYSEWILGSVLCEKTGVVSTIRCVTKSWLAYYIAYYVSKDA